MNLLEEISEIRTKVADDETLSTEQRAIIILRIDEEMQMAKLKMQLERNKNWLREQEEWA